MNLFKSLTFLSGILLSVVPGVKADVTYYELQPSNAKPISSLTSIKISFPEAKFLGMYGSDLDGVTLTKVDDPSVVYVPFRIQYSTFEASNSETFSLKLRGSSDSQAAVITDPGEYRLHFPAECFNLCGSWYAHIAYSEEINEIYTISPGGSGGYDDYMNLSEITVTPASGRSLRELDEIKLKFPVSGNDIIEVTDVSVITMKRTGENPQNYVVAESTTDENTLVLRFRRADSVYDLVESIYEPGEYAVDIPEGAVRIYGSTTVNPRMELNYTIAGDPSGMFSDPILTPRPGTVKEISDIVITYPGLTDGFNFPEGVTDITPYLATQVYLRKLNNDPYSQRYWDLYSARLVGANKVRLRFKDRVASTPEPVAVSISTPGDYQLTVKANVFKAKGSETIFNQRIEALYSITGGTSDNPLENYILSPADGARVGSFNTMQITFPELADGVVYPWEFGNIRMVNAANPEEAYRAVNVMTRGNTISWGFNLTDYKYDDSLDFSSPATYNITIDAGTWADHTDPNLRSPEITAAITVDPDLNFRYTLSPADGSVVETLSGFTMAFPEGVSSPAIVEDAGIITIARSGDKAKHACAITDGDMVYIPLPEACLTGTYTLRIPAGAVTQVNAAGTTVPCPEITASVKVTRPEHFSVKLNPEPDSQVTGLPSVTITPVGRSFRSFEINGHAGNAVLSGNGASYVMTASSSSYSVALFLPADALLTPGTYTLTVPEGFINIVDGNGLTSATDAISVRYFVTDYVAPDLSAGIMFINEGAFGSDYGSINFLSSDYSEMYYEVFRKVNKGMTLGVTSQFGQIYKDKLLVVSKQADYDTSGALLTVADAATLRMESQTSFPPGADGRSVCVVSDSKAYVGTSAGVYVFDMFTAGFQGLIEGTKSSSGAYADQIGDMILLGGKVYAACQNQGVIVIDTATDTVISTLPLKNIVTVFLTSENRLFAATDDPASAFVEINPATLSTTSWAVDNESMTLKPSWAAWRKAPLATSMRYNTVYYATRDKASVIASYDFDSGVATERFISLPSADGRGYGLYGTGLSVDPVTGYVVLTAVQTSPEIHYNVNAVLFADPETGEVKERLTFFPKEGYWFPAMAVYPSGIDSSVIIPGADSVNAPVAVYTIDGRYVASETTGLAPGLYVVRTGIESKKIIIK